MNRLVLAVTLFAAVFAASFGPGVMPSRSPGGGFALILCSGNVVSVPGTSEDEESPSDRLSPSCDWALVHAGPALAELPVALESIAAVAVAVADQSAPAIWPSAHEPRGPFARGPPALI